jgi:hypothetical protein
MARLSPPRNNSAAGKCTPRTSTTDRTTTACTWRTRFAASRVSRKPERGRHCSGVFNCCKRPKGQEFLRSVRHCVADVNFTSRASGEQRVHRSTCLRAATVFTVGSGTSQFRIRGRRDDAHSVANRAACQAVAASNRKYRCSIRWSNRVAHHARASPAILAASS